MSTASRPSAPTCRHCGAALAPSVGRHRWYHLTNGRVKCNLHAAPEVATAASQTGEPGA